MSTFHYDMRSKEIEQARVAQLASQVSNSLIKNIDCRNRNPLSLSLDMDFNI